MNEYTIYIKFFMCYPGIFIYAVFLNHVESIFITSNVTETIL